MAVIVGFFIACAIALTGVGAGTITAPVLMLWLDVPPAIAVGTALAFGALVKIPAAISYWRQGHVDVSAAKAMIIGGLPGVLIGSIVLETFDRTGLRAIVLVLVGVVVLTSALFGLLKSIRPANARPEALDRPRRLGLLSLPIGLEVGFSSAGAGALGTLVLLHYTSLAAAAVVGTDIVFGLALALVGGGLHVAFGSWDPTLLLQLGAGGLLGVAAGTRLAGVMPNRVLRVGLLLWLTWIGSQMTWRAVDELVVEGPVTEVAPH